MVPLSVRTPACAAENLAVSECLTSSDGPCPGRQSPAWQRAARPPAPGARSHTRAPRHRGALPAAPATLGQRCGERGEALGCSALRNGAAVLASLIVTPWSVPSCSWKSSPSSSASTGLPGGAEVPCRASCVSLLPRGLHQLT